MFDRARFSVVAALAIGCGARSSLEVPASAEDASSGAGGGPGAGSATGGSSGCSATGQSCGTPSDCCHGVCVGGTCGEPACAPGDPVVTLAAGLHWPLGIAVDGTNVYFTTYTEHGRVYSVPKAGGAAVALTSELDFPNEIVLDAADLYVTVAANPNGMLLRIHKDGSSITTVVDHQFGPAGIAIDGTTLFFANYFGGTIARVATDGTGLVTLATGESNAYRLAAGPTALYWSGSAPGLRTVPKEGGSVTNFAGGTPRTIRATGTNLYWTDTSDSTLDRSGFELGSAVGLAGFPGYPDGVEVADDGTAYVSSSPSTVFRVRPGAQPEVLADGQNAPALLAVDDTCVYWTNTANDAAHAGSVMRAPR